MDEIQFGLKGQQQLVTMEFEQDHNYAVIDFPIKHFLLQRAER